MTNNYYYKEKYRNEPRERDQSLSEERKDKMQKKTHYRYQNLTKEQKKHNKNLSEKQKKKLPEYRRNYYLTHKK